MSFKNTSYTYGSIAKFLHWLIFLLLAAMVTYGYFLDDFPKEYQPQVFNIHKVTGLLILTLMVIRLAWRFFNPKPLLPFGTPRWEYKVESLVHFLLYAVVLAMPIAAWIGSSSAGKPPHIGTFVMRLPLEKNEALIKTAFFFHNNLAIVLIILVSLHVLAALYHHFIRKDNILRRMMPNRT